MIPDVKYFPKDLIGGKMDKVGDEFVALFMRQRCVFQVTELFPGGCFAQFLRIHDMPGGGL